MARSALSVGVSAGQLTHGDTVDPNACTQSAVDGEGQFRPTLLLVIIRLAANTGTIMAPRT